MKFHQQFPDFTQKRVIDAHMDQLDTHGMSRRDFLALMSAGAAASASAAVLGIPAVAIADPGGKVAYLQWSASIGYLNDAATGAIGACKALGIDYVGIDAQFDMNQQLNQFEQQAAAGTKTILLHSSDGSALKREAEIAAQEQIYFVNVWATLPWFTPFETSDYWALYAVPEEFSAHRGATAELLKKVTEEFGGGEILGVTGVPGHSTDTIRSRGRDDAFKDYPKCTLVDQLAGNFGREDSQRAADALLAKHPNIVGVVAQNDDSAQGVIASLRAAGYQPGVDVFVTGADGTNDGVTAIKEGRQLATSANVPAYLGAMFTMRLYDVSHDWKPRDSERMMYWRSVTMTKDNVDDYLSRYVNNDGVEPFDYKLMSKVLHPDDWDPQAEMFPMDIDNEWAGTPKPEGWQYPQAYLDAKANEWADVAAEYQDHYKIDLFGPSPNKAS